MAFTQISDVIVPEEFTEYVTENSVERNALSQSGVAVPNQGIVEKLSTGGDSFKIPYWKDLGNEEANIGNDDPDLQSTPIKIDAGQQTVRKSFLNQSWSSMNLASELAGSNAMGRIQERVAAYWERQFQRRLLGTIKGVLAENQAGSGDMIFDRDTLDFSGGAVIDATATLGDRLEDLVAIAIHSDTYRVALHKDEIDFVKESNGSLIKTYRGLAVIVDDTMPFDGTTYTSCLFGAGAIGYGMSEPSNNKGTEIESKPSIGNGAGGEILHSRVNMAVHPFGYRWAENNVVSESPTLAELENPTNWVRIVADRKQIPLAFILHQ
ncbi:MAG: major capsid protein [Pseudomonadota bacterium]